MTDRSLFDPVRLGDLALANRIVMAPLTRNRAVGQLPNALSVEYYRQRASAGLIVTEGSQISPMGQGYLDTPGIHSPEQVKAWRAVTDAVHAEGGRIVIQLWHVGRVSHPSLLPGGAAPVSSTARAARGKTYLAGGFAATGEPRALTLAEIPALLAEYRHAARCAREAGFDGVEIHGANGYLLEQFLRDSINDRTDAYGGTLENRARLMLEAVRAVADEIGAGRTGLRLSPVTPANDAGPDSDPAATYGHVARALAPLGLAYLHVVEGQTGGPRDFAPFDYAALKSAFGGPWVVNNGYTAEMAQAAVAAGAADAVAFGRAFISNPDLVRRLREGLPLTKADSATFYGGAAEGYTDYARAP